MDVPGLVVPCKNPAFLCGTGSLMVTTAAGGGGAFLLRFGGGVADRQAWAEKRL